MSLELSLSGFYTYNNPPSVADDGHTNFKVFITSDGVIHGSGSDNLGEFVLSGTLIKDDIRFIKLYVETAVSQTFVGTRASVGNENIFQFSGLWGPSGGDLTGGKWALSGIALGPIPPPGPPPPKYPFEGSWDGVYYYGVSVEPPKLMSTSWTIRQDPQTPYDADGTNTISGSGKDSVGAFKFSGSVTKEGIWNAVQTYTDTEKGVWRYEAFFDSHSTIAGIWRPDAEKSAASGGFTILKQKSPASQPLTLESALEAAAYSYSQGISSDRIIALGRVSLPKAK